ncbi:hypothetical protein SNOG_04550 [Parastagonospora nodorum SN15]|uniref:Uncharacterized protein n=1 Tax=Phaeosphaeria nodorum (strain SN15 / ATCC MYA-4574 / FGSC 10173) TaxID=321614 RepID=Q0UUL4_PHANO|nr:hypothetical protein SNOG_04550 [Parastagonospora nodorum SN15]EAT88310.1 hypothetical protein SNOG_04550 [Parastagonospora nodorum SN15]
MLRSSNSMMKQKAFSQLGSENPAEEQAGLPPSAIPPRSFGAGNGNEAVLSMRGKKLQSLSQGGLKLEEESESGDSSERSQQLPVSLDYHNALADQYHEAYLHDSSAQTESTEKNTMTSYFFMRSSKVPSKSAELMPRPLSWKKDPNGSSPGSSQSNIHTDVTPNSQGVSRRHRKVAAWVPFHQRTHSQHCSSLEEEQAGSASDSASATRREISGVEKLRLLNKEIILSKLVPQVKRLRSNITGDDLAVNNQNLQSAAVRSVHGRLRSPISLPALASKSIEHFVSTNILACSRDRNPTYATTHTVSTRAENAPNIVILVTTG